MCTYSKNTSQHSAAATGEVFQIMSDITCTDRFIIYSIKCRNCPQIEYIGQTSQRASDRFHCHKSDIINKKVHKPVPFHFCLPNHSSCDMIFLPFEKLNKPDKTLLDIRERFWIDRKQTLKYGLNKC